MERELKRWRRDKHGCYGLLEDCESRAGRQRAQTIIDEAWAKLKRLGPQSLRDVFEEYEQSHRGTPRFDTEGRVGRRVGGTTGTTWKRVPGGFRQTGSGRILIGSKWICRQRRAGSKFVVIAVMKTLVHEVMGHWNRLGQRVEGSTLEQRRVRAEEVADRVTERVWRRVRRSRGWDDCIAALEDDCDRRARAAEKAIRAAIRKHLKG